VVVLPFGFGNGYQSTSSWIRTKVAQDLGATKAFPDQWGDPPEVQTNDGEVDFPEGWGRGSPVVGEWIARCIKFGGHSVTKDEEQLWSEQQKKVEEWEVKELLRFLECADQKWGLDDEKAKLVTLVHGVQRETLEKYLDKVSRPKDEKDQKKAWKEAVDEFLGTCLDSVNTRPPTRQYGFIHVAAQQGDCDTLLQMVKLGADIFMKAHDGKTARELAAKHKKKEAEEYLAEVEKKHSLASQLADKRAATVFQSIGKEVLGPRIFKRTSDTMFVYNDDSSFTGFSKLAQTQAWDCNAISIEKGVTKMTVKFEKRGTTKQSGLADTRKRPCIFGLIELTGTEVNPKASGLVPSWLDLRDASACMQPMNYTAKGVWVCCEIEELVNAKDTVAMKYAKEAMSHSLVDVTPEDILTIERTDTDKIVVKKSKLGKDGEHTIKVFNSKKPWGDMYAKFMMYDPNDCILVNTEPGVGIPNVLRQTIGMQQAEYTRLLHAITRKMLPDWLRAEIGSKADGSEDTDPTDEKGHMMYVASLITMLSTRAWTKAEAQAQDTMIRKNYQIPFNHDWVDDLGKVLKKIWNNGGVPSLGNLRAVEHSRIPGSCKNKAVLALVLADVIRPKHEWVAWTVWRTRTPDEAEGRFPHKKDTPIDICFCQLHCVNAHLKTGKWFDVIRFWDRDPHHKWPLRYPDPELLNIPTPSNYDLTAHSQWMRNNAAPGGKEGYSCPKKVPGSVPYKLHLLGVEGDKIQGLGEEEEEEEDDDIFEWPSSY